MTRMIPMQEQMKDICNRLDKYRKELLESSNSTKDLCFDLEIQCKEGRKDPSCMDRVNDCKNTFIKMGRLARNIGKKMKEWKCAF